MDPIEFGIPFMTDVDLDNLEESLRNIEDGLGVSRDPNEVVFTSDQPMKVLIDYPLDTEVTFEIEPVDGKFVRKYLVEKIIRKYMEIYREEAKSTQVEVIPKDQRVFLLNRNQTDGKYGIWGHDLSDLSLRAMELNPSTGEWLLEIDS